VNFQLIGDLIRLRYKLMWARTRTRNGKIAMFAIGYLLLILVVSLLAAGGVGAATIAVRSGKALFVTRVVLTSLYAQALFATVMLGFGMSAIFSDVELRRYPITASERRLVRHLIGIIDPFWILTFALELGLLVGLYAMGATSFWPGLIAVLLLLISNYAVARLIEAIIDRMTKRQSGSMFLMMGVMLLSFSGAIVPPLLKSHPGIVPVVVPVLAFTPPFGAASAMTQNGAAAIGGYLVEILWIIGALGILFFLESRPFERQTSETTVMNFESGYDRAAVALGFDNAPLVGWWLRFYARNGRFKALLVLSLPMAAFLTFNFGGREKGLGWFPAALGAFPIVTFLATARFMVNQFGYLAGGYRRCFLLPVEPAAVLRTGSYASLVLSAGFIPAGLIAWIALAPVPFDARQVAMLACSAVTGMFTIHGLGLWASLYGPRRGNYQQSMGNDLSLFGNIVLIGGVMVMIFSPMIWKKFAPVLLDPAYWWIWLGPPIAAFAFYRISLRTAEGALAGRREQLMAIVEGRA
jgi:predicted nucleic acid-binding Zn ribbon protein